MTVFGTVQNHSKKKKKKSGAAGTQTAGEVFHSCQSWALYHYTTKLRQFVTAQISG